MGTPVPEIWPELEDEKWYKATEYNYEADWMADGCDWPLRSIVSCCRDGAFIKLRLSQDYECVWGRFICNIGWPFPKRLICIIGPYDTQEDCVFDV